MVEMKVETMAVTRVVLKAEWMVEMKVETMAVTRVVLKAE